MSLCQSGPVDHHAHESSGRHVGGGGGPQGEGGARGHLTPPNLCLGDQTKNKLVKKR